MKKEYPKVDIVLHLLRAGYLLNAFFLNPHSTVAAVQTAYDLSPEWDRFSECRLRRTIDRLRKRNLVRLVSRGNETVVELTDSGRNEILRFAINSMEIKKSNHWDGKWWQVIFDIPDNKKKSRNIFQKRLKMLGFYFIQESVCVHPYPCQKEIEFLREVYDIKPFVNLARLDYFEEEYIVKDHFGL